MNLDRTNICLAYAFRISGLPYIFSTINLPDAFADDDYGALIDDEYYYWKANIVGDLQIGESKIQPWLGIASPASFKTSLALDSTLKGLLNKNLYRSDGALCQLTGNCTPSYTFFGTDNTADFASTGFIYANNETVYYGSKTTTRFANLIRGYYGSYPMHHFGTLTAEDSYGSGIYITNFPLSLSDRIITVWIIQGNQNNDGKFVPDEASLDDCDIIYTGVVKSVSYADNLQTIDINCTDLISLLEKEIGGSQLKALLPDNDSMVNIDEFSELFQMEVRIGGVTDIFQMTLTNGYRTLQEVLAEINTELATYSTASFGAYKVDIVLIEDNRYKFVITCNDTDSSRDNAIKIFVGTKAFIKELGFTETQIAEAEGSWFWQFVEMEGSWFWQFIADTARPVYRIEQNLRSSIIVVPQINNWGSNFADPMLMADADGNTLKNYVRIGDEIFEFDDYDVETYDGVEYNRLYIVKRGCFGTLPEEPKTVYTVEDDIPEVIRGIAIDNLEWPRLIAYLLVAGNQTNEGYDEAGWLNMCAAIPRALIDETAFTNLALSPEGSEKHKVYIDKPTSIKDIIESILVLHQAYLITENGKITIKTIPSHLATDANDEFSENTTFTEADILSVDNLGIDVSEDFIVNVVRATDIGFNWCTEEATETRTIADGLSCGTFGRKEAIEVSFRTLQNYLNPGAQLQNYAGTIFGKWSSPFEIINITVNSNNAMMLNVGDPVTLNHAYINEFLGVSGIDGRIFGIKKTLKGNGARTSLMVISSAKDGTRNSLWAPCAKVVSVGGKPLTLTIYNNYYNGISGLGDNTYFYRNCVCRCFNPGEEENYFTFVIVSDGTTVSNQTSYEIQELDNDASYVDPSVAVVEYVKFDYFYGYALTDDQKKYVFLANASKPFLEDADSNDYPPFHYL